MTSLPSPRRQPARGDDSSIAEYSDRSAEEVSTRVSEGAPRATLRLRPTVSPDELTRVDAQHAAEDPRHRWYYFKEAFSPAVVEQAISDTDCKVGDLVVDPFCGSGTVPLTAIARGRAAWATEVNPFLAFVARAKLHRIEPARVLNRREAVVKSALTGRASPLENFSTFGPGPGKSRWLFNRSVLRAFEGAWSASGTRESPARDLVRLCLLGAAMDTCNATRDGKCLRYRREWKHEAFDALDFVRFFETRINDVADDLEREPLDAHRAHVRLGDARAVPPDATFQLCVTSPPYLNSFDYTDVYRPELFMGRFVETMSDLRALRLRTLRSHVQVAWPAATRSDFGAHFTESLERLRPHAGDLWDGRIPGMVQAYFEDMRQVLGNLRRKAAKSASLWLVVSTSAYAGVEIPVDLIIADIGGMVGWHLREVSVLRYLGRVAGQQWDALSAQKSNRPHLRESLVILDATPRRAAR